MYLLDLLHVYVSRPIIDKSNKKLDVTRDFALSEFTTLVYKVTSHSRMRPKSISLKRKHNYFSFPYLSLKMVRVTVGGPSVEQSLKVGRGVCYQCEIICKQQGADQLSS